MRLPLIPRSKSLIPLVLLVLLAVVGCSLASSRSRSPQAGRGDVVVLCSNCYFPGSTPEASHLVLLDGRTGDIWAYSDSAIVSAADPIYVGTLEEIGKPIVQKRKSTSAPNPGPQADG